MVHEKKKLLIRRIIWLVLLIAGIVAAIILGNIPIDIVEHNGYITDYSNNTSYLEIEVTFNHNVISGDVYVAFYDSNGDYLSTSYDYFYSDGNTALLSFEVYGKADSYEIVNCDVYPVIASTGYAFIYIFFILVFFIAVLLLSCKVYEYNGNSIVVYAGWFHHYIKVNGEKFDEHNTLTSYTPILLSCVLDDGAYVQATISRTNRISLKINNRLYTKGK